MTKKPPPKSASRPQDDFQPRRLNKTLTPEVGRGSQPQRVSAKKHSESSKAWLDRQLKDPYVQRARAEGYRSRAAFKLLELDEKFRFLKPGQRVVDLGCAPGGWLQVLERRGVKSAVGIDLLATDPVPGITLFEMDFMDEDAPAALIEALGGPPDLVLSDMAPNTTGHARTDHLRILNLVEAAAQFAIDTLAPGGTFVTKVFQGGASQPIMDMLNAHFASVKHAKPKASRAQSAEMFLVAQNFRP